MPHGARKVSESGYYHVVPKGINGRIIFEDDADRGLYLSLLSRAKDEYGVRLPAYCLMSNHVHLILDTIDADLGAYIKYVHERYGMAHALKYGHVGGVFAKTCWSEPIETDEYLLCAVRYVHANPANAGICPASAYEWSSAKDYLGRSGIADTGTVLDMLGGRTGFIEFSKPQNGTLFPFRTSSLRNHLSDDEAARVAKGILGFDPRELAAMEPGRRNQALAVLGRHGFTRNLMMRLTGLGRRTVQRCLP